MAYEMVMPYHLHMPSYFLETFTEYPSFRYGITRISRKKNKENLCFPCNLCFREFCVIPCLKNRKRILVLTYPLKSERGFWVCFSIAVYTSAAVSVAFGCASAVRLR